MRFTAFKEFKAFLNTNTQDLARYISRDLKLFARDLQVGLTRLSFADNFESFEVSVTMPATTEVAIRNELDVIPTKRLIVLGGDGAQDIVDGDTAWDTNFVYLKNTGSTEVTVSVVFIK